MMKKCVVFMMLALSSQVFANEMSLGSDQPIGVVIVSGEDLIYLKCAQPSCDQVVKVTLVTSGGDVRREEWPINYSLDYLSQNMNLNAYVYQDTEKRKNQIGFAFDEKTNAGMGYLFSKSGEVVAKAPEEYWFLGKMTIMPAAWLADVAKDIIWYPARLAYKPIAVRREFKRHMQFMQNIAQTMNLLVDQSQSGKMVRVSDETYSAVKFFRP